VKTSTSYRRASLILSKEEEERERELVLLSFSPFELCKEARAKGRSLAFKNKKKVDEKKKKKSREINTLTAAVATFVCIA
jgi:hypothetical protein